MAATTTPAENNNSSTEDSSLPGLLIQFALTLLIVLVCLCVFELVRSKRPKVYSPKTQFVPQSKVRPAPKGFLGWLAAINRVDDKDIDTIIGGDATIMLMYLKYSCVFFVMTGILGLLVLIPTNANGQGDATVQGLDVLSMGNIAEGSSLFWVHCACAWIISLMVYVFLYRMHYLYIRVYHAHRIRIMHSKVGRTLMIDSLPSELRTKATLETYFKTLGFGAIEALHVYRNIPEVEIKLEHYNQYLKNFEKSLVSYSNDVVKHRAEIAKAGDNEWLNSAQDDEATKSLLWNRVGESPNVLESIPRKYVPTTRLKLFTKVNALDYYGGKVETLKPRILRLRGQLDTNDYGQTHTAFMTMMNTQDALKGSQVLVHSTPLRCITTMAPEPRNIIWTHLKHSQKYQLIVGLLGTAATIALTFFWLIPVALIVSLTSLENLSAIIPGLSSIANASPSVRSLIQNVLPTVLTAVLMSLLPAILYAITKAEKPKTFSNLEIRTFSRYFLFLIFNVLLVFTLGGTILKSLNDIINNPPSVVNILAQQLPKNATFFINYIVLGLSGFAMELLQLPRYLFDRFKKYIYKTPRSRAEFYSKQTLSYYSAFPPLALFFTIALVYSIIAPLITPFAALLFALYYLAYKYQLLYVYSPAYETGGTLWPSLFDITIVGVLLCQLTLIGILSLKKSVLPGILVIPLLFLTVILRYYCKKWLKQYAQNLPLEYAEDTTRRTASAPAALGDVQPKSPPAVEMAERGGNGSSDNVAVVTQRDESYFYRQDGYNRYVNPALVEDLEDIWLPEYMKPIDALAIDWSKCGRNDTRAHTSDSQASLSPQRV